MFELNSEEKEKLQGICSALKDTEKVCCTRYYSWKFEVKFEPEPNLVDVSNTAFSKLLDDLLFQVQGLMAPEGKGDLLGQIKGNLIQALGQTKKSLPAQQQDQQVSQQPVDNMINTFSANSNESWQQELLRPMITALQEVKDSLQLLFKINEAKIWI